MTGHPPKDRRTEQHTPPLPAHTPRTAIYNTLIKGLKLIHNPTTLSFEPHQFKSSMRYISFNSILLSKTKRSWK